MIKFIFQWQTLIGAVFGGLLGITGAFIVAFTMRRREELASAMVVVGSLSTVKVAYKVLISLAEHEKIEKDDFPQWFSEKVVNSPPKPSTLFETSMARIMPVNRHLAAHLIVFHRTYSMVEKSINNLSRDFEYFHEHGEPLRPQEYFLVDCRHIERHFSTMIEQVKCAENMIQKMIIDDSFFLRRWHRMRLRFNFCLTEEEKSCTNLRKEGRSKIKHEMELNID